MFVSENVFLFFAEFKFLIFHSNVKISEKLNNGNLLKICLQITYPIDFCIICIHFHYGKKRKYLISKPMTGIKLFVHSSYDKLFWIETWMKFANFITETRHF